MMASLALPSGVPALACSSASSAWSSAGTALAFAAAPPPPFPRPDRPGMAFFYLYGEGDALPCRACLLSSPSPKQCKQCKGPKSS
eukprot:CAMPEP_0114175286 /NCGR_PEP_ID=MMETSP0043_2-20121206/36884_1 /TAXON_ID=464988 /ORGANISM="Hemiselmis andersenii, Strain CCMP644" /LENGTH=84 /DNA_ID=CAMNT_0001273531 /DNA_START=34 /DNA_END=285 /DNA_ORIENTATION=-